MWQLHRLFDRFRDLVHRVRAQHHALGAGRLQCTRRIREQRARPVPVAASLQCLDLVEVDAVQHDLRRMQAAEPSLDGFVNDPVVGDRRFPTHAADQADRLHGCAFLVSPRLRPMVAPIIGRDRDG
jgi:hypothetical protein